MPRAGLCVALLFVAGAAFGKDDDPLMALQRAVEMPAHQLLMRAVAGSDRATGPFSSDGCSGGLSAGWETAARLLPGFALRHEALPPWQGCCVTHDRAYHDAGGAVTAEASFAARLDADLGLQACVEATGASRRDALVAAYGVTPEEVDMAYRAVAAAMFNAVRLGGGPCTGLPWRWGFGLAGCVLP